MSRILNISIYHIESQVQHFRTPKNVRFFKFYLSFIRNGRKVWPDQVIAFNFAIITCFLHYKQPLHKRSLKQIARDRETRTYPPKNFLSHLFCFLKLCIKFTIFSIENQISNVLTLASSPRIARWIQDAVLTIKTGKDVEMSYPVWTIFKFESIRKAFYFCWASPIAE